MSSLLYPQVPDPSSDSDSDSPSEPLSESDLAWQSLPAYIPCRSVRRSPYKVFLRKLISEREDGNTQVFRGDLHIATELGLSDEKRDVVCKVAYGEHQIDLLKKEADLYSSKLLDIQDTVVPVMYGCYVGITQDGHTGVLVLQYCGVPLTVELKYYSGNVRFQAVNALLAIHRAGVQHNDFVERNLVVVKDVDGDPYVRVVDFGRSCEHTCPEELDVIKLYDRAPWKGSFKCYELYDVCTGAEVWTDRCAIYFYRPIPIEYATSVDSILAYAGFPPGESESNARKVAQEAINDINLWWRRRKARDANPASIDLEDNDSNNNNNNADDNDNHDNNLNHSDDDGDAE